MFIDLSEFSIYIKPGRTDMRKQANGLSIIADEEIIQVIQMEGLEIGYGRSLSAQYIELPSTRTTIIIFELDYENSIRELNELNNIREMSPE